MSNDGGPAFPQSRIWNAERAEYEDTAQHPGMSLRDWFAGMAPAPSEDDVTFHMRLDAARNPHNEPHKPRLRERYEIIAFLRYRQADAMLAARNSTPTKGD